jgi:hypothetical protein
MRCVAVVLGLPLLLVACTNGDPAGDSASGDGGTTAPVSTLPQTCTRGAKAAKPATCNGSAELCARPYDRVAVPMTHNAMSSSDEGWAIPNQTHGLARQLADGIRGMMLDIHYRDPESKTNVPERIASATVIDQVSLCHGSCLLGNRRLLDGLCDLTSFLDANAGEVLTLIFETNVADKDLDEVLRASGLAERAYAHAPGKPWATLRELIDTDKRVVIFVERGGGSPPYIHPAFESNIFDTPYTFENKEDFTCAQNRGSKKDDPLFLVNHWLGRPTAKIDYAREVNVASVLGPRVEQCTMEATRIPTFVAVDFYEVGDLFSVVKKTNGIP